ncbi:MAG: hypothetical protein WEC83_01725 [Patescibacteria group bacterium]
MKTKVLLFLLFAVTLFAAGTLLTLIYNVPPSGWRALLSFYGALFLLIFGLVFFVGYGVNRYRFQALPPWQQTATVSRYGILFGLLTVLSLIVSAYIGLSWPLFMVLVALIAFTEILWRKRRAIKLP